MNWKTERCWITNRGDDLSPVESCEGIGNPHYFYTDSVFALAGTTAGWLFILGALVSDTVLGGAIAVSAFAFNHGEATRVQWTPPLRESFAFPMIIAQIATLINLDPLLGRITLRPLYVALTSLCFVFGTLGIKLGVSKLLQVEDDAHIFDILRSKFTDYSTFHTRLYTCSKEFDFISLETLQKLFATWLIPASAMGILLFVVVFLFTERKELMYRSGEKGKPYAEIFYNVVQTACYAVMALLIMRLKLFFTPHLCICSAFLANNKLLHAINIRIDKRIHAVIVMALIAAMAYEGKSNIDKQLSMKGEYNNPEQELLFEWIMKETKPDAVFAGTMPVMANVKLTTLRPIANHPHYEDVRIRNRTKLLYSMFSKKPINELHETLKQLGVNYFVFQLMNCAPDVERYSIRFDIPSRGVN
ncbi:hypothetical protein TELCIR_08896 [Teladorsagia circumcincta]|uniref:Uncharacterized protein n=1 Tax=Teladorsagia circumcincta TaxID=45464 RepID=A0A2G9UG99_TELCI|nr:hypothetical protein TELCIR_08896 [Teladorsagia circumcincta]